MLKIRSEIKKSTSNANNLYGRSTDIECKLQNLQHGGKDPPRTAPLAKPVQSNSSSVSISSTSSSEVGRVVVNGNNL